MILLTLLGSGGYSLGVPIYIAIAHIISVAKNQYGSSVVSLTGDRTITVVESPEDILRLMEAYALSRP